MSAVPLCPVCPTMSRSIKSGLSVYIIMAVNIFCKSMKQMLFASPFLVFFPGINDHLFSFALFSVSLSISHLQTLQQK